MGVSFAFKYENSIFLAGDSFYNGLVDENSLKKPHNFKIWKVQGMNGVYMSYQGNHARLADILKTNSNLLTQDCMDGYRFKLSEITKNVIPKLYDLCEENGLSDPSKKSVSLNGEFLLTSKEHMIVIASDGHVTEYDDFCAIGISDETALGAYGGVSKDQSPVNMSIKIMETVVKYAKYNRFPMALIDVRDNLMHIIEKETILVKDAIKNSELV